MNRVRLSTTVDAALLTSARGARAGLTDAALIDEAPAGSPDTWGDLGFWRQAAGNS